MVKVRKEKESRRLEEVDLDTGRRRSWVETTEHDVIDLTGETPAKNRTPLTSLQVNSRTSIHQDLKRTPALKEKPPKSPLLSPAPASATSPLRGYLEYLEPRIMRGRRASIIIRH